jgi:hypothetical protein
MAVSEESDAEDQTATPPASSPAGVSPQWSAPGAPSKPSPAPAVGPAHGVGSAPVDDRHVGSVALPVPLRPLTIGEIVDGAFRVLKRAPGTVLAISAIFVIPSQLIAAWAQRDTISDIDALFGDAGAQFQGSTADGSEVGLLFALMALGAVAPAFVGACLARLVTGWYAGRDRTASEVFRALGPTTPALIAAFALSHLLIGLGVVACVVPGAVLMVFFVVTMPVVAVERCGPVKGLQRSVTLVAKRFWPTIGVVTLSIIGSTVLDTSLTFIPTVVAFLVPSSLGWMVMAAGSTLASMIVTPVVAAATVLLYLDLRFRAEGLDLDLRSTDVLAAPTS